MLNVPEILSNREEIAEPLGLSKDSIRNGLRKIKSLIIEQVDNKISEVDAWVESGQSAVID